MFFSVGTMIKSLVLVTLLGVALASPFSSRGRSKDADKIYEQFIVGGRNAEENEFPYQVGFRDKGSIFGYTFCGGSIISDEWLLTAGHCFFGRTSDQMAKTEVVIGTNVLFRANKALDGLTATVHPQYHPNTSQHVDLTLIHVAGGGLIQKSDKWFTSAVKLNTDKNQPTAGSKATVSGFGTAFQSFPLPNLWMKTTDIEIEDQSVCKALYEGEVNENDLCAGDPTGKTGACFGDSGGPLVVGEGDNRVQVGVVSRGIACAQKDTPKLYVHVASLLPWITEVTGIKFH